jgi:hypothetical protein
MRVLSICDKYGQATKKAHFEDVPKYLAPVHVVLIFIEEFL